MLRALFFAVKIGLIIAAAVWVMNRPGVVELEWLGYHVTAHVGIVLLGLLVFLLFAMFIHRVLLAIAGLPRRWKQRREHKKHEKGYKYLTQGLTAVAAGDARQASEKAGKTRASWPDDKALSLLLEAQAARLRGEEDVARSHFDKLLENKDTAFLGLRGLLVNALEHGDTAKGLALARKAQNMHKRQPWIVRMVYDLEIQEKEWEKADRTLRQAVRLGAVEEEQAVRDQVAMLAAQAEAMADKDNKSQAIRLLRKAQREDPSFPPIAQRLAMLYLEGGNKRAAQKVIEKTWQKNPHPDLIPLWYALTPEKKGKEMSARLNWFEKLVALKPDSAEGQLAAAQAAIEDELWGQARQYLDRAAEIKISPRLCRLYAQLEEKLGHTSEANTWLEKAADAPAEKVWTCRETGRIYEHWSPLAKPHGSFNTIVWDYPKAQHALAVKEALPQNELLITAK